MNKILEYLDVLFPNPKCELIYNKDYELLISIMLSAQTTDKRVNEVTSILYKKYDSLEKLKNADIEELEKIIKPLGTQKRKSLYVKEIALLLLNNGGVVPNDRIFLERLPGIGRKTVNVFLATIYNEPLIGVDTHVQRVSKRLGLCKEDDDVVEIEKKLEKIIPKEKRGRSHHQFVLFGRYYCTAKNPKCLDCKLKEYCKKNKD